MGKSYELLAQAYAANIDKRDPSNCIIGKKILPKVLEWNKSLWDDDKSTSYFMYAFSPAIISRLLNSDRHGLFQSFENHVDECEKMLKETEKKGEKDNGEEEYYKTLI